MAPQKKGTAVALLSGGLDSGTLAFHLVKDLKLEVHFLSFDYGQRHSVELNHASRLASSLGQRHDVIHLPDIARILRASGTSLTNRSVDVPDGHYAEQTMKATIVPNRNAMMLAIAYSVAVAEGVEEVACGVHGGDHYIYPDCRPAFIAAFERAMTFANDPDYIMLYTPYIRKDKTHIAFESVRLGVGETWSCYKGGETHCGTCGTCTERKEAFILAKVPDPTEYLDSSPPVKLSAEGQAVLDAS
jgi:7-cyano-7-deazaguanine synthase